MIVCIASVAGSCCAIETRGPRLPRHVVAPLTSRAIATCTARAAAGGHRIAAQSRSLLSSRRDWCGTQPPARRPPAGQHSARRDPRALGPWRLASYRAPWHSRSVLDVLEFCRWAGRRGGRGPPVRREAEKQLGWTRWRTTAGGRAQQVGGGGASRKRLLGERKDPANRAGG